MTPVISGADLTPKNQRLQKSLELRLNRWFQESANRAAEALRGKYKLAGENQGKSRGEIGEEWGSLLLKDSDPGGDDLQTELLVGGKKIPKIQSDLIRALALLGWGAIRWNTLAELFEPYLDDAGVEGVDVGVGQVQMTDAGKRQQAAEDEAEDYAKQRSAELAGMKRDADGKLVPDEDAHWPLTDVMQRDLEATITMAVTEGWTADQLAAVIEGGTLYAFSPERAEVIANTEITNAQSGGTYSLWRKSGTITLVRWVTSDLEREPDECDGYEEQGVVPLGHEFAEALFSPRAHPNCFLSGTVFSSVDHVSASIERWFEGELVHVKTFDGNGFTCTPNHPVLTRHGWVKAGNLNEIDELVKGDIESMFASEIDPYNYLVPTTAEYVAGALLKSSSVSSVTVPSSPEQFHGDGMINGNVNVVWADSFLRDKGYAFSSEQISEAYLVGTHCSSGLVAASPSEDCPDALLDATQRFVGSHSDGFAVLGTTRGVDEKIRFVGVTDTQPSSNEGFADRSTIHSDIPGDIYTRFASKITFVKVVDIKRTETTEPAHVYNLQTASGYYFANGFIVHNCRCSLEVVDPSEMNL